MAKMANLMCRRRTVRLIFLALLQGLSIAANAQPFQPGQVLASPATLGAKQIPLPAGEWRVAGYGSIEPTAGVVGAFGALQNLIAFRIEGDEVDMMAEISINALPVVDGWGLSRHCLRRDIYLTVTQYKSAFDGLCYFVKRTIPKPLDTPHQAWSAAETYAAQRGLRLPDAWITVGFRLFDRQDVIDVRYHFNPEFRNLGTAGTHPNDAWKIGEIEKDDLRLKFIEALSVWALHSSAFVEAGLRNRLASFPILPMPERIVAGERRPDIVERLRALEQLYSESTTSNQQLDVHRDTINREQSASVEGGWLSHSLKKNLSFRVFGSIVDWILAFTVTLSAPVSTGITASIVAIHSVIFVFNDRLWDTYWANNGRRDGTQLIDFVYVGGEE